MEGHNIDQAFSVMIGCTKSVTQKSSNGRNFLKGKSRVLLVEMCCIWQRSKLRVRRRRGSAVRDDRLYKVGLRTSLDYHSPTCLSISSSCSRMFLRKFWKFYFSVLSCSSWLFIRLFSLLWWAKCRFLVDTNSTILHGYVQVLWLGFAGCLHFWHRMLSRKHLLPVSELQFIVCRFWYWL